LNSTTTAAILNKSNATTKTFKALSMSVLWN